jgi:hypothetical protein
LQSDEDEDLRQPRTVRPRHNEGSVVIPFFGANCSPPKGREDLPTATLHDLSHTLFEQKKTDRVEDIHVRGPVRVWGRM